MKDGGSGRGLATLLVAVATTMLAACNVSYPFVNPGAKVPGDGLSGPSSQVMGAASTGALVFPAPAILVRDGALQHDEVNRVAVRHTGQAQTPEVMHRRIGRALQGAPAPVRLGIDVLLSDSIEVLRGMRVGLITNHTGRGGFASEREGAQTPGNAKVQVNAPPQANADMQVDRAAHARRQADAQRQVEAEQGVSTIDLLDRHPAIELVALFSPEHGIRGAADPGEEVAGGRDARTGLPIHSLYGEVRKPTADMLAGLDALVFDIQDIGTRYYTYVWTMALAMQAAAEEGIRFVVLDRPNPIGGEQVQGNVLDPAYATFVGLYPVPMRHGLTTGEVARLINGEYDVGADLVVVPTEGWRRDLWQDDTGLPWINPSPNMPSLESATHYPGTCLFEGTNLSVGRGTPRAFQQIGAPWLDHETLVERLEAHSLPGVRFAAVMFTPEAPGDGKYGDEAVRGVRLTVTDRQRYDPTVTAVAMLVEIYRLHAGRLEWRESHFDRLAGTARLRERVVAGASIDEITAPWAAQLTGFRQLREQYLLY